MTNQPVRAADSVVIRVDTRNVVRDHADRVAGINLNYIRDADANRILGARPLVGALNELKPAFFRYPGGEKSNYHVWARPPFDVAKSESLGWYKTPPGERMNLDAYIDIVRKTGATPFVVVAWDGSADSLLSHAQQLEQAVAWVKHANVTHDYGVKYWEIGNENWNKKPLAAGEMAKVVVEFSRAMKAVDPTILIGSNGQGEAWWREFLPVAGHDIDFISLSVYNTWDWKSYDRFYRSPEPNLVWETKTLQKLLDAHGPKDRKLPIMVVETNSKDYSPNGWAGTNTLGHALVTFETLALLSADPRVAGAMVWNTRWMNDSDAPKDQFYALDASNQLLPTGRALSLWNDFPGENQLQTTGQTPTLKSYARATSDGGTLTVWLVNRSPEPAVSNLRVDASGTGPYMTVNKSVFTGTGPNDPTPSWTQAPAEARNAELLDSMTLPGCSVTVIVMKR